MTSRASDRSGRAEAHEDVAEEPSRAEASIRAVSFEPSSNASDSISIDSLLAQVARVSTGRRRLPELSSGTVVAGRYRLERELGRGANGVVWEAWDAIAIATVAIKLATASRHDSAARARAEIASLRRLRVAGVAHLIDEGTDESLFFLVMPIVRGAPFPGRSLPATWSDLVGPTELLLETLARVHALGVVHRDLKPANVLVDALGRPTVLDFGLSIVTALGALEESGLLIGTPAYLAPEQLIDTRDGARVDARADLYAVGVMLYRALSGKFPHDTAALSHLLAQKGTPAPPLSHVVEGVPEAVRSVVDTLLATRPEDRFASASETLSAIRGIRSLRPSPGLRLEAQHEPDRPFGVEELRQLFGGDDRLSRLKTDGATRLFEASNGTPARVRETVARWIREGRCRWAPGDDESLLIDREALDQLEGGLWASHATNDATFVENAIVTARSLAEDGRHGNAMAALHEALTTVRRALVPSRAVEERILSFWCELAVVDGAPSALDRVLYEICRSTSQLESIRRLEALARAALATFAWSARASSLAESLLPFDDAGLERCRMNVRVLAARRHTLAREESVVNDLAAIASRSEDRGLRADAAAWLGKLRYRQGRYEEAAQLQLRCASLAVWRSERVAATLHAASATLEAFDDERTLKLARAARDEAHETRNAQLVGRAEWLMRSASYRLGKDHGVDAELLGAARGLGLPTFGLVGLVEAAHAYRAGEPGVTALAEEVYRVWASSGEPNASLLAGSLAIATGAALDGAARARLRTAAWRCTTPGIGIQAAALLRRGGEGAPPPEVRARLAATVPADKWSHRMDILSVDESLALLAR